jgi:phenylalanyl-tRNA synthetase alpha chain
MQDKIEKIIKDLQSEIETVKTIDDLGVIEQKYFSRKSGVMSDLMKNLSTMSPDEKKVAGKVLNDAKVKMEEILADKKQSLEKNKFDKIIETEAIDVTAPQISSVNSGTVHLLSRMERTLQNVFRSMGFIIFDGPELESEYYNFTAVNIPADHPARDMQDTFYISGHHNWVMRTHTSSTQIRALQKYGAPIRVVVPGRCFRNEATDARHEHTFDQIEGMVVGPDISFAHMKGVIRDFLGKVFGMEVEVKYRPKFYPFVEPGVNVEMVCVLCKGEGCKVCKNTGWLEIGGAGMIHPAVLREGGIDPNTNQGFAFGLGVTRLVMLKYGIKDARHILSSDLRQYITE